MFSTASQIAGKADGKKKSVSGKCIFVALGQSASSICFFLVEDKLEGVTKPTLGIHRSRVFG